MESKRDRDCVLCMRDPVVDSLFAAAVTTVDSMSAEQMESVIASPEPPEAATASQWLLMCSRAREHARAVSLPSDNDVMDAVWHTLVRHRCVTERAARMREWTRTRVARFRKSSFTAAAVAAVAAV